MRATVTKRVSWEEFLSAGRQILELAEGTSGKQSDKRGTAGERGLIMGAVR